MSTSKAQREGMSRICKCGCNQEFIAFGVYRKKVDGGGLRFPEYMRGHHPNTKQIKSGEEPWNKGLKKGDHPSIDRMGFQTGHAPHNNWDKVNHALKHNIDFRKKWLESKRKQVPWNKGITRDKYPNGIATGEKHGNWKGGKRGFVDTAEWERLRCEILKRDNYTCQHCGDKNRKGRGSRCPLEVHHIVAICESLELALDPKNLITLCRPCHFKTHNYGFKTQSITKHKKIAAH